MSKSRKPPARSKAFRGKRDRTPGRETTFQISGDGVALSLQSVRNPIPRGTFGGIGHFYRVSSDRPFSNAPILIAYESRDARSVDESTLALFRWDEGLRSLVLVPDCGVNVHRRYVFGRISSPGIYGVIGLPKDERVLRTIAMINAIDPAEFRNDKTLLPKVCWLILCARGPAGGPAGGNLCERCLGLEIPQLGLPEGQLVGKRFPGGFIPSPAPMGAPWPMYGHDPRHTGRSPYPGPTTQPVVLWQFRPQVVNPRLSHPVVDENGTVYIGAIGQTGALITIWALDGATGMTKWSHGWNPSTPMVFVAPQPAVGGDGAIYANIGNVVWAFTPDGTPKWIASPWTLVAHEPLPAGDTVYVFNWRHLTGASGNALCAFDTANGISQWPDTFETGMFGFLPIAVRDDGRVIVAGSDIWALAPNQTVEWMHALGNVFPIQGSPAVADDGTVYVGLAPLVSPSLRAITASGAAKAGWTPPPWGTSTPAIAADGTVYIGFLDASSSGGRLDARNADGTLKWSRTIPGGVRDAPAIGGDGAIYLASGVPPSPAPSAIGGSVYALHPATGLDRWTVPLGQSTWFNRTWSNRSPAIGLNRTLYVVDNSTGTLYAFK